MSTTIENLREIVRMQQILEEGDDKKPGDKKPDDKKPEPTAGEPSEATRAMMKALPPEWTSLLDEYEGWTKTCYAANIGATDRQRKVRELLFDFFLKASKLPKPETAEQKVESQLRRLANESGVDSLLSEVTIRTVCERVADGDRDYPRRCVADLVEVARKTGYRNKNPLRPLTDPTDFANVRTRAEAVAALKR